MTKTNKKTLYNQTVTKKKVMADLKCHSPL